MTNLRGSPDDRALFAVALDWVSRIMTVAVEMVAPGLAGLWLDRRLGSLPGLTLAGFAVGLATAIWHLLQMTGRVKDRRSADGARRNDGKQ